MLLNKHKSLTSRRKSPKKVFCYLENHIEEISQNKESPTEYIKEKPRETEGRS